MINYDFKMRERFEQREYFGDKNGETRLDKKIRKEAIIAKKKWWKENERKKFCTDILNFISRFQNTDTINTFTNGCCYWFAYILHGRFPETTIMYDAVANHFVAGCDGRLYDITGDVTDKYSVVAWNDFSDKLQRQRIIKQCVELEENSMSKIKADIYIGYRALDFIKSKAKKYNLSLLHYLKRINLSKSKYYDYKNGVTPGAYVLQALAEEGADINFILTGRTNAK